MIRLRTGRNREEVGSATVHAVVLAGVLTTVALLAVAVTGLVAAHRQVQSAADLAALAGASALQRGEAACQAAVELAQANGSQLRSCEVRGAVLLVEVSTDVRAAFGVARSVTAQARAGPAG